MAKKIQCFIIYLFLFLAVQPSVFAGAWGICEYGYKMPREIFEFHADWFEPTQIIVGTSTKYYATMQECQIREVLRCNSLNLFLDVYGLNNRIFSPAHVPSIPEYHFVCVDEGTYEQNRNLKPQTKWNPIDDPLDIRTPSNNIVYKPLPKIDSPPAWLQDFLRDFTAVGGSYAIGRQLMRAGGYVLVRFGSVLIIINSAGLPQELYPLNDQLKTSNENKLQKYSDEKKINYIILELDLENISIIEELNHFSDQLYYFSPQEAAQVILPWND